MTVDDYTMITTMPIYDSAWGLFGTISSVPEKPNATVVDLVNRTFSDKRCADFMKAVLKAASTNSNPVLKGGDIGAIFSAFTGQTKGGISRSKVAGAPYGTASGRIGANGTISSYPQEPPFDQDRVDANTIVNELPHIAGSKGGWPVRDEFDDFALANAVNSTEYGGNFSLKGNYPNRKEFGPVAGRPKNPFNDPTARKNRFDSRWSNYFHNILRQECTVPSR
jgi:hypothetical protein